RATNCDTVIWTEPELYLTLITPRVVRGSPTIPGIGSAQIHTLLQDGQVAETIAYWGDNNGGTNPNNWDNALNLGPALNDVTNSAVITGLLFGIEYWNHAYATNGVGDDWASNPQSWFTLIPNTDPILNLPATSIGTTSAVFNANVDGSGAVYEVSVFVGTSDGGTDPASWLNSTSLGTFTNLVGPISNTNYLLIPGFDHYYRYRVSNPVTQIWSEASTYFFTGSGADLVVSKSVNPSNLLAGTSLVYSVVVSNAGLGVALGVVVTDTLPAMVTFVSSIPAEDSLVTGSLTYSLGNIAPNASTSITINVTVNTNAMATLTNRVSAHSRRDTNLVNNSASAETALPDFDSDGLRDFVDPDDDNDGVSDEDEFIADTDPFDDTSFFWLSVSRSPTPSVQLLTFPSSSNRIYFIQSKTNLFDPTWTTELTNRPGMGGLMNLPRTNAVDLKYYRIGVERP
ncbi:MAG: DUF11 domain-containing protein, partial [Verrucomicrobiota bacterium]